MSFPRSWSLYPLGIFLFIGLLTWISDFKSLRLDFVKKLSLILPLIVYFLLHLIWPISVNQRWFYIEGNLMFLLIPLFGFPLLASGYFSENLYAFLKSFIYGIIFISLFEFLRAIWGAVFEIDFPLPPGIELGTPGSRFTTFQLSFLEHPTYLSIKVLFAVVLLIVFRRAIKLPQPVILLQITALLVFVFLLSSRTGILICGLLLLFFFYHFLKKIRLHLFLIILGPLIIFIGFKIWGFNTRINFKTELFWKRYKIEKKELRDIDPRFTSWFTAIDIIKEHPVFGVGLNSKNILAEEYQKQGYNNEASLRLNAHNQFLETQMTFGIIGSLTLLWMLFAPFYRRNHLRNPLLYYSFLIIIVTAFLFESVLVRQWGIMFFVLFYCVQVLIIPVEDANTSIN